MHQKPIIIFILLFSMCFLVLIETKKGFGPYNQDWGYVKIREKAHIFWWLHYTISTADYQQKPLIIWLQGGPGSSSTGIGNFLEIGPLNVDGNQRNITWINYLNVLFVDNPVGAGFSYTEDSSNMSLYPNNNTEIAGDFLIFLKAFLREKQEFTKVPLYIVGQSYGGKMAADIALSLHKEIQLARINCNFKGIVLGDAWISPVNSLNAWPLFLYNLGFVDTKDYVELEIATEFAINQINSGDFERATAYFQAIQVLINTRTKVDFYNVIEPVSQLSVYPRNRYYQWSKIGNFKEIQRIFLKELNIKVSSANENSILKSHANDLTKLEKLMNGVVREALNLTNKPLWDRQSDAIFNATRIDFMKPVTESIDRILSETNLEITIYDGQLDLVVPTSGTMNWINNLTWIDLPKWNTAKRSPIIINGINEGYSKSFGRFSFYWINRAGHSVPTNNPSAMEFVIRTATNTTEKNASK